MALINNIYVLADTEEPEYEVQTATHPTESGVPNTDTIRRKPTAIRLSGVIADTEKLKAEDAIAKLKALQKEGSRIKFIGACGTHSNMQIQSFAPSYTNKVNGGAKFDMTLQEFRTAKTSYVKQTTTVTSTKKNASEGDTVTFKGGYVYVASDAKKPASKRGQSTCKLTKISTLAGATHIYHLISTDGKGVYGWVDAANVSGVSTKVSSSSSAGTQQVQISWTKKSVWHTVKKGDTVYKLARTYNDLDTSISWIVKNNPNAFSEPGDVRTLKIGAKVLVGYRKTKTTKGSAAFSERSV